MRQTLCRALALCGVILSFAHATVGSSCPDNNDEDQTKCTGKGSGSNKCCAAPGKGVCSDGYTAHPDPGLFGIGSSSCAISGGLNSFNSASNSFTSGSAFLSGNTGTDYTAATDQFTCCKKSYTGIIIGCLVLFCFVLSIVGCCLCCDCCKSRRQVDQSMHVSLAGGGGYAQPMNMTPVLASVAPSAVVVHSVAQPASPGPAVVQVQAAPMAVAVSSLEQAGVAAASVAHEPAGAPPPTTAQEDVQKYYNKYTGFDGVYCTDRAMRLGQLIPLPTPAAELLEHVRREHTAVPEGCFGASCTIFMPWNYKIKTTPEKEFQFAYLAPDDAALPKMTLGTSDGEDLGDRLPRKREVDWRRLQQPAVLCEMLNACLKDLDLKYTLTEEEVAAVGVKATELMLCTMYTGPMFAYYNTVTRAVGNGGVAAYGIFAGQDVREDADAAKPPRFAHSIHGIASGVGKLAFALPTKQVYRGFATMRLPEAFRVADKFGVRAGADYGFLSTTLDQRVALHYSKGATSAASTVLAIQMDESNRGALIAFLSYYPSEREILFAPLARLEVRGEPEVRSFQGRELTCFRMQIHV